MSRVAWSSFRPTGSTDSTIGARMGEAEDRAEEQRKNAPYRVLARRFRPTSFDEVVGQEAAIRALKAFLAGGRVPHAFLFSGSRGVGKTTSARILARAVNCERGVSAEPCGACEACRAILEGRAPDVIELDAASHNGVDDVRTLREQAGYSPLKLRRKVFILDEVHMLSRAAFNALLKILEEPPPHVLFVLATTELHKVPETVRSRCQVLPFRRIGETAIRERLAAICHKEGVAVAPEVLAEIAASCMGGLRDAETALERILPMAEGLDLDGYRRLEGRLGLARAARFLEAAFAGEAPAALHYAAEAVEVGADERECLGEVLTVCRLLLLLRVDGPESLLVDAEGEWRERLLELAADKDPALLDAMIQLLMIARDRIRTIDDRRVLLELTLLRLVRLGREPTLGELSARVASAGPGRAGEEAESSGNDRPVTDGGGREGEDPLAHAARRLAAEGSELGTVLERATARWVGRDRLCLEVAAQNSFQRALLERPESRTKLSAVLAEAFARPLEVELRLDGDGPRAAAASAARAHPPGPVPQPDPGDLPPLARRLEDLFDARLVDRGNEPLDGS